MIAPPAPRNRAALHNAHVLKYEPTRMDIIAAFRILIRVAETGSFSAVARERGLTQPAVSRQIAALEQHLGARLLQRTTHSLALTEDGRDLLGHARLVVEAVERAESAIGPHHAGLSGRVRLGAGGTFGRIMVAPRIHRLLERHPALEIDLRLENRVVDMVHEGFDIAIRLGTIAETALIARRIGAVSRVIVASPGYLAAHPAPQTPEDLAVHSCILLVVAPPPETWRLQRDGRLVEVAVSGRFRTDSVEAVRAAVLSGIGLAELPVWMVQKALADGRLRQVLADWQPPPVPVHAVYPSLRNLAPRTRAVIDFLVEEFKGDPALAES